MGLIYHEIKDYKNAISSFLKVIELEPENANAHFDLAVAYVNKFREKESSGDITPEDLEDLESGFRQYLEVIKLDPDFPYAQANAEIVGKVIDRYENKI